MYAQWLGVIRWMPFVEARAYVRELNFESMEVRTARLQRLGLRSGCARVSRPLADLERGESVGRSGTQPVTTTTSSCRRTFPPCPTTSTGRAAGFLTPTGWASRRGHLLREATLYKARSEVRYSLPSPRQTRCPAGVCCRRRRQSLYFARRTPCTRLKPNLTYLPLPLSAVFRE